MEKAKIKLYPIDSELSKIPDLILDEEKNFLLFEIRDFSNDLSKDKEYSISITKGGSKIDNAKIIDINLNEFKVDKQDPLTKSAKTPFEAILQDSEMKILASGIFYRYRTDPKKSPSTWDKKFNPERHKNYKERSNLNNLSSSPLNNAIEPIRASELINVSDDSLVIDNTNNEKPKKPTRIKEEPIFHSFLLNIRYDCNKKEYDTNITEKLNITNRAIRILKDYFKVRKIAHFKINFSVKNTEKNSELEQFLVRILTNGICVEQDENEKYCYIGSSNSGRKERNFWAIDKESCDKLDFKKFLNFFGNFSQFSQIQKLNKRYSLLYSSSVPVFELKRLEYKIIKDFENNNYCFTDGVGIIRQETCEEISKKLNLDYTSYIFQIRIGGFKGVLTGFSDSIFNKICPGVDKKVKILFRKTQEKFESYDFDLNIVSWASNISVPANLNSEILMILDGLCGEKFKEYILRIFQDYLDEMEKSLTDPKKAFAKLFNSDIVNEFTHKYKMILLACRQNLVQELDPKQYKIIRELIIEQGLYNIITKRTFNIQIEKSRYFIGVIDETDELKEGEIYVSYRNSLGNIEYLDGSVAVVCRVPCYSVTEARKVRTKYVDELSHLENCVVFPKRGSRPLTDILSGGDLDGDLYFVSWDDHLTDFENSKTELTYPTDNSSSGEIDEKIDDVKLLNQLAEVYASDVVNENNTGLWHYFLLCSYDQDRKNMLKDYYLSGVKEINKCIDGIKSSKRPPLTKKPLWYISSSDLENFEKSKEEKFNFLKEIIERKKFKFSEINSKKSSLLECLATRAIKKFIDILEANNLTRGEFLDENEILLLKENDFIIDLSECKIESENLEKIEKEYRRYIEKVKKIENGNQIQKDKCDLFKGMYERQESKNYCSEKDKQKAKFAQEFRDFVVKLRYFHEEINDENMKKSVYSINGLYFRSRVVNLYKAFKDKEKSYQIPWMFYDVLCLMKNFCNDNLSLKVSTVFPTMIPFSMSAEFTNIFSTKKLSNFNKIS